MLVSLDTTVNIAFPAITAAFELEVSQIQWVVISYVLTFASLLLISGRLSDAFGHRRVLLIGVGCSGVGVLLCGLAPAFGWFLAFRVVQGVGAALVLGAAPALVTSAAPDAVRARALGGFQMGSALGLAVGPALGGVLLRLTSWRSVYLFRAPAAVIVIVLVAATVATVAAGPRVDGSSIETRASLDIAGALTVGAGLAAGLLALSRARAAGWSSPLVIIGLVAAVGLLAAWVVIEGRSENPVVDLALLRQVPFAVANGLNVVANATMFAIWLLVPYYLLTERGQSTIGGGVILGMSPLGTALAAPVAGRLAGRIGIARLSTLGLALESIGLMALAVADSDTSLVVLSGELGLVGIGLGLFSVPNLAYVMGSIPRSRQGVAGGLTQMMRTVGVVAGVAGSSIYFDARQRTHAGASVDSDGFIGAFRDTFLLVGVLCAIAAAVSVVRPAQGGGTRAGRP